MKEKIFAIPEYTTAEDIKDLRKRLKLTQKEFAELPAPVSWKINGRALGNQ